MCLILFQTLNLQKQLDYTDVVILWIYYTLLLL